MKKCPKNTCGNPAPGNRASRGASSGFTLFEVLIALVVLAVGASVTLSAISGSLGNVRKARMRTQAMEQARAAMESALYSNETQEPGTYTENLEDGLQCTVRVEEYDPGIKPGPDIGSPIQVPVRLLRYTVELAGPDSALPAYRLETLKLVKASEQSRSPLQ